MLDVEQRKPPLRGLPFDMSVTPHMSVLWLIESLRCARQMISL